jgi:hypothetical protein
MLGLGRDLFLFGPKETTLAAQAADEYVLLNIGTSSLPQPFVFAVLRQANLEGSGAVLRRIRSSGVGGTAQRSDIEWSGLTRSER